MHDTHLPRSIYVLTGCIGVIGSNSLVLGPIAPEVALSLGTSVPTVMLATAAFGLGAAISALLLARHIDRFGAHRVLKLTMALLPLALMGSALAPFVAILVAAQFLAGMATGVAVPAIYASAAATAPPGRESKTIGIVLTGWTLSMVARVSLAAIVADAIHWRAVYGTIAVMAGLAWVALRTIPSRSKPSAASAPLPLAALGLVGIKPLLLACAGSMMAFYGVYGYLGDHLRHGLNQPISVNGLVALVYGLGFGGAALFDGLARRITLARQLTIALLCVASTYLMLAWLGHSLVAILMLLGLLGLTNHFGINLLIVRLTAIDSARRGTIMGLHSAVTNLAVFAGTAGFGPLYATHGFAVTAYAATALTLAAALASTRQRREHTSSPKMTSS